MSTYLYLSLSGDDRIAIFRLDPHSGKLMTVDTVATPGGPAPLAMDPAQRTLYAGLRNASAIAAYRIDPNTGGLMLLGQVALDTDPCYLATDRQGRYLFSAYYRAGKVAVHAIGADGAVGAAVTTVTTAEHAHALQTDPSNRFAYVPHVMPANHIAQFEFDAANGVLTPNRAAGQITPEGPVGPRHFVFHPHQNIVYADNEQGGSVTAYDLDPVTGALSALQTVSTLPPDYSDDNLCAQIHIHPTGRFLYVSNRGHDSIACFAIEATGRLQPRGHRLTEKTPRAFNLDPVGNFLYVAGLDSGRLAAYHIDPAQGTLHPRDVYGVGARPCGC